MPLVALALLWVTVALPRTLARMALLGGAGCGGGFGSRTASYVAARRADAAIGQALPARPAAAARGAARPPSAPPAAAAPAAGAAPAVAGAAAAAGAGAAATGRRARRGGATRRRRGHGRRGARRAATPPRDRGRSRAAAATSRRGDAGSRRPAAAAARRPAPTGPSWQRDPRARPGRGRRPRPRAARHHDAADVAARDARRSSPATRARPWTRLMDATAARSRGEMVHQAARADIERPRARRVPHAGRPPTPRGPHADGIADVRRRRPQRPPATRAAGTPSAPAPGTARCQRPGDRGPAPPAPAGAARAPARPRPDPRDAVDGGAMNVAFKHLEAKLRFGELTIGQWAAVARRRAVRARRSRST